MILARISKALREQNWLAIAIEFLIVILGVLLAFQISQYAENRTEIRRAEDLLQLVEAEMAGSLSDIRQHAESLERQSAELLELRQSLAGFGPDTDTARLDYLATQAFSAPELELYRSASLQLDNAVVQRLIQGTEVDQALRLWQRELANLRDTEQNIEAAMGDGDGQVLFPGLSKESLVAAFPDIGLLEDVPVRFPSDWEALSEDGNFAGLLALVSLNIEYAWFVTNRLEARTQTVVQALQDRRASQ